MPVRGEDHGLAEAGLPTPRIGDCGIGSTWELEGVMPGTSAAYHVRGFARGGAQVRRLHE